MKVDVTSTDTSEFPPDIPIVASTDSPSLPIPGVDSAPLVTSAPPPSSPSTTSGGEPIDVKSPSKTNGEGNGRGVEDAVIVSLKVYDIDAAMKAVEGEIEDGSTVASNTVTKGNTPLASRLVDKSWAVRKSAYDELANSIRGDLPFEDSLVEESLKGFLGDSNAGALVLK